MSNMMKGVPTTMILQKTFRWACTFSRKSLTISPKQLFQQIPLGIRKQLLLFCLILESKVTLFNGQMNIFYYKIKLSLYGRLNLPMANSMELYQLI